MALTGKPTASGLQVGATGYSVYNNAPIEGAITRTFTKVVESSTPGTATETLEYELAGFPNIKFSSTAMSTSTADLKSDFESAVDGL